MKKNFPLVSILTPVHNGEKLISKAIESVLSQTYLNWNYTIIENYSTDNTLKIAQSYAKADPRIKVIQTDQLLPIIDNHNFTMRQISVESKYCKVLHSDDLLFPECIELMVEVAEKYPSAGVISSYRLEEDRVLYDGIQYPIQFLTGREVCRRSLLEGYFHVFGSPSTILMRSDLVQKHDPLYPPRFFADVEACFNLLKGSDFGFVHQVLSINRLHASTYTSKVAGLGMNYLGNLNSVVRFGSFFLNNEEYDNCFKKKLNDYYRFLGVSYLQRREKEFWQHQENTLNEMKLFLDWKRIRTAALGVFIANITRPGQYMNIIRRWFKGEQTTLQYRL
jgi:glycosyltransferase involved in cell wall biosynthesis